MKKHKDILYTCLGIGVIATLILITYYLQQPKSVVLEFPEQPKSEEHILVSKILGDTEAFAAREDSRLNQTSQSESIASAPIPVTGAPLPVAWDSKSAPTLSESELSPSLQRSLAASASLHNDDYINPTSNLNLERVEDLRTIRKNRHISK